MARQGAFDAVSTIKNHPVWTSGAKLAAPGLGLRPDLVNTVDPDSVIRERLNKLIAYDPEALENPTTSPTEAVCSLLYGGLCERDQYREQVVVFCINLAGDLRRHGLTHKQLPIHLDVRAPGDGDRKLEVLLGFKFGRGDFFSVLRVAEAADAQGVHYFRLQYKDVEDVGADGDRCTLTPLVAPFFCGGQGIWQIARCHF